MNKFGHATVFFSALSQAAPNGINIGSDGTNRDKAQTYQMLGGNGDDQLSIRLNLYDKDAGGMQAHGDLTLSVVGIADKKMFDLGFCLRPIDTVTVQRYDCLNFRSYY